MIRIRRKGNPSRPWCVLAGHVVLANFPTWHDARYFTTRYLNAFRHYGE
ncbi:hypothetical protein [Microbacterium telephonicum]|uniref:Uncharacterized protein n=1 Tax=Microbacterium telephonicum TaxID=1714841 RepID=A0A498BZ97_9MICO|nr:hypothetical protein [Microbacterium telephonicum]RLK47646.1 hypothetical protein C7474_2241 [Microbacterium telephonicum]